MTISLPAMGQQSTGDPFLDAMLRDQKQAEAAETSQTTSDSTSEQSASTSETTKQVENKSKPIPKPATFPPPAKPR